MGTTIDSIKKAAEKRPPLREGEDVALTLLKSLARYFRANTWDSKERALVDTAVLTLAHLGPEVLLDVQKSINRSANWDSRNLVVTLNDFAVKRTDKSLIRFLATVFMMLGLRQTSWRGS